MNVVIWRKKYTFCFLFEKRYQFIFNIKKKIFLFTISVQGRIQGKLEKEIARALSNYEQNLTSVMTQFPAQKINNAILDYLSR